MLHPAHDASATAFAEKALAAIVACDLEALRAAMTTYVRDVHGRGMTLKNYFYPDIDMKLEDAFVNGEHSEEDTDDDRFEQLVLAALNPQDAPFTSRQLEIAKLMGKFVNGCENGYPYYNPAWEIPCLRLMDTPGFVRYDLVVEFFREKSLADHNEILLNDHPTRRSLYTKLLVLSGIWDTLTELHPEQGGFRFHGLAGKQEDFYFRITNASHNRWMSETVLPMLHAVIPEVAHEDDPMDEGPWHRNDSLSHDNSMRTLPTAVTKLRALLLILATKLKAPATVDAYVRPLRELAEQEKGKRLFVLLFVCKLQKIKMRAVAQVQARYAPTHVETDANNLPIVGATTAPAFVLAQLAADTALGGAMGA